MRRITDFSDGWLMDASSGGIQYQSRMINLPFIHDASEVAHIELHKLFRCIEANGSRLYLELDGITGIAKVYCNSHKLISHVGCGGSFRVLLTDKLEEEQVFSLRVEIETIPRKDGKAVVGRARLLETGNKTFRTDEYCGSGIRTSCLLSGAEPVMKVEFDFPEVEDGDSAVAFLYNEAGEKIVVENAPATEGTIIIPLKELDLSRLPVSADIELSVIRGNEVLDNIRFTASVYEDALTEKGFVRNGRSVRMQGVSLADLSAVRSDFTLMPEYGFNSLFLSDLTAKNNIFRTLDGKGYIGWYDLPFTGMSSDFVHLREMLEQNSVSPAFRFICCSSIADDEYVLRFTNIVNESGTGVIPVLRYDLASGSALPAFRPRVIMIDVRYTPGCLTHDEIERRYASLCEVSPDSLFAVSITPPTVNGLDRLTALDSCRWHRYVYTCFADDSRVIAYFAGDIRSGEKANGLHDGRVPSLAAEMYKAQYGSAEFLCIEADENSTAGSRNSSVIVFSNNPDIKILVNSKPPKNPVITRIAGNIFEISGLKLTGRLNLIEISAGEQCDNITIQKG